MPRNESGVFSRIPGTEAVADTTISSAAYNATIEDLVADANAERPVSAGGTGAATAEAARASLFGAATLAQADGGTGATTLGGATVTPTGGSTADTLASWLGLTATGATYASRTAAASATVPTVVQRLAVITSKRVLHYARDASGTALTTADGAKWSPASDPHVAHWGAVGDGVTDATAAIQAAIDWTCTTQAAARGLATPRLEFGPGKYAISSALTVTLGRIEMVGIRGATEIIQKTADTAHLIIGDGGDTARGLASNSKVTSITFVADPVAASANTSGSMLHLYYVFTIDVSDCIFYGRNSSNDATSFHGLTIDECLFVDVRECRFEGLVGSGIKTLGSNNSTRMTIDCHIFNPYFSSVAGVNISIEGFSEAIRIFNPAFIGAGNTPIHINTNPSTERGFLHVISDANIEQSSSVTEGIYIERASNVLIQGGWIGRFDACIRTGTNASNVNINGLMTFGPMRLGGTGIRVRGCMMSESPVSGDAAFTLDTGLNTWSITDTSINGFTGGGVDCTNQPVGGFIDGLTVQTITGEPIIAGNYLEGPRVGRVFKRLSTGTAVAAASTLTLPVGADGPFRVTGATALDNITLHYPGRRITIQAGTGGISFSASGNIRAKATTLAQDKTATFVCDHQTWFEDTGTV